MFNLLISYRDDSWAESPFEIDKSRVAVEYTVDEISERYKFLDENAKAELMKFPTLFVTEGETVDSRIGYLTNIRVRERTVVIDFVFDPILPTLPSGTIEALRIDLDLGTWELSRTHWAIKDEPLFEILIRRGYATQEQVDASLALKHPIIEEPPHDVAEGFNTTQIFVVHGHDELAKLDVTSFVTGLGLEPIVLHMQASAGRTIIEKIEYYSNVGFAIVLYTPCDEGSKVGALTKSHRARQNVLFEHGYLIGKLGRPRVVAVVKGEVETPNDISGVVYISMADPAVWQEELKTEIRDAGFDV